MRPHLYPPLIIFLAAPRAPDPDTRGASTSAAAVLVRAGHLPVDMYGVVGAELDDTELPGFARRLLARCDAVLYVGRRSAEADELAALARWEGKPVYHSVAEIVPVTAQRRAA